MPPPADGVYSDTTGVRQRTITLIHYCGKLKWECWKTSAEVFSNLFQMAATTKYVVGVYKKNVIENEDDTGKMLFIMEFLKPVGFFARSNKLKQTAV